MDTSVGEIRTRFKDLHKQKTAEVNRATRRTSKEFYPHKADESKDAARRGNQKGLFKELGQARKTYNGVIKDADGNKLTSEAAKIRRWKEHFEWVLNNAGLEINIGLNNVSEI